MNKRSPMIWFLACAVSLALLSGCQAKDAFLGQTREYVQKEAEPANERQKDRDTESVQITEAAGEAPFAAEEEPFVAEDETNVSEEEAVRYAYSTLDEETRLVYDEIYQAIVNYTEKVSVSTLDTEVLDAAYCAVDADHGELFWVSGYAYTQYTLGTARVGLEFSPKYTMTEAKKVSISEQIEAEVEQILAAAPPEDASDYEKARYVFEYLASHVDYEIGAQDNQNIISVFLYKKTVCQGYATATQYLLQRLGIQSSVVSGTADGQPHAWNLARLDGAYYYIDTTWGNSAYAGADTTMKRFINYSYFGVTSKEIAVTHQADDTFLLPECTATEDNYYVREGRYFTEFLPDEVGMVLKEAYDGGVDTVSIKFSSGELYTRLHQYLIEDRHISDYCKGISSLYYVEDTAQNVLTFRFS